MGRSGTTLLDVWDEGGLLICSFQLVITGCMRVERDCMITSQSCGSQTSSGSSGSSFYLCSGTYTCSFLLFDMISSISCSLTSSFYYVLTSSLLYSTCIEAMTCFSLILQPTAMSFHSSTCSPFTSLSYSTVLTPFPLSTDTKCSSFFLVSSLSISPDSTTLTSFFFSLLAVLADPVSLTALPCLLCFFWLRCCWTCSLSASSLFC